MPVITVHRACAAAIAVTLVLASCAPAVPVSPSCPSTASPPAPTVPGRPAAQPPDASLGVEGGDLVPGALGSFEWGDGGSASPWLPGTPIAAGAGELARLTFDPPIAITAWQARVAEAPDGDGALRLADGTTQVSFGVPDPGEWTIEVAVQFADGIGSASYYWRMIVQ